MLDITQVLVLWDLVLGYDDLDLIAVVAAALLCSRSGGILGKCRNEKEVAGCLRDFGGVGVVELIKGFLF